MVIKWLLIFSLTAPAWAYKLTQDFTNGFYWASLPVNFSVIESDPTRKVLLSTLAQAAITEWENKTGFSLWDMSDGSTNIIRWSTNFQAETQMDPMSVLAVAVRYSEGPYFAKSEIIINGSHSAFNSTIPSVNKMNLGTTLVHELGHTMGLDHSDNMLAVMAPTLQYPYNGLHSDDLNGMAEAHTTTEDRQVTRYISPLAYSSQEKSSQPVSCGTTGAVSGMTAQNSLGSLGAGILIGFIKKIIKWFKSLF